MPSPVRPSSVQLQIDKMKKDGDEAASLFLEDDILQVQSSEPKWLPLFKVSAMQPPSSATPLIGIYFSSIMVIVAASTTVTIAILNFHHRGHACNSEMPPWIRSVFLQWLPWILRIERPGSQEQLSPRAFLMENKVKVFQNAD